MKHLFVLLIFISLKNGLQAQVTDSTTMKADSASASNMTDSATTGIQNNNMNSSSTITDSSRMNNMHTTMSNGMDSMKNSTNNMMNNKMPNSDNMTGTVKNSMNAGMQSYAALPVMESYIPADVMDKIKSKYGNGTVIYDITAVRAVMPTDSSMQQTTDSSMQQQRADSASAMAVTTVPVKYNYVVRTIKDGTIQTECLADDGTTPVMPGEMNKPQQ